ncbi:MAG: GNAT family N-acetyltransferase [Methylotenera sp.]|nr:GNAT family N-acetyltransferase [Methylotenera sp.]
MLSFRLANIADAAQISDLVNAAYRGETSRQGWTTEADLLDGLRTTPKQVKSIIISPHQIILLCLQNQTIVGTICLESLVAVTHIGMFAVNPNLQGNGVGKQLLTYAEAYAKNHLKANKLAMHVIALRYELIAFYERRGYQRTGVFEDFPVNPAMWQVKVNTLNLELLEKILNK